MILEMEDWAELHWKCLCRFYMDFFQNNKKEIIKLCIAIAIVLLIVFIVNKYFFSLARIEGDSMDPALRDKDIIIIDKTIESEEYERFDIVAFEYMYNNKDVYVKRVIGLPNETIEIIDNVIYIDGERLSEFYGAFSDIESSPDIAGYLSDYPKTTLGPFQYFVIGDNRYVSDDSRNFGAISSESIIGKAVFRIWSFDAIGSLKYQ